MKVTAIRSDKIYGKMIFAKLDQRDDIYRYEQMKPFEFKWSCIGIPIKADQSGGYQLIKYYLKKTGKTIFEATITSTVDILKETEEFWN